MSPSYRDLAEAHACDYRARVLRIGPGEHNHWLTEIDGNLGKNFVESFREDILIGLKDRKRAGKGINWKRTTTNLLSSQAMCFNLFFPLQSRLNLLTHCLKHEIPEVNHVNSLCLEFTPPNEILGDQAGFSGVDCDALIRYNRTDGKTGIVVIETKYVEREFSNCAFRRKKECASDTFLSGDLSECHYKSKKNYKYWDVTNEGKLLKQGILEDRPCPFGDGKWQLWTNFCLSYGIKKIENAEDFHFIALFPRGNSKLSNHSEIFDDFRSFISQPERFHTIFLEDLVARIKDLVIPGIEKSWINEFEEKYLF
ncbi:MAG: hypothetical protein HQM08_26820 [Candidatus Riflebacteria bacterium]|nr:hypothetical protein [Candidatus Riflebacteria bacterium]